LKRFWGPLEKKEKDCFSNPEKILKKKKNGGGEGNLRRRLKEEVWGGAFQGIG